MGAPTRSTSPRVPSRQWALGLRRIEGVERRSFADEFGNDPLERWRDIEHDLLEVTPESVRLSPTGRLFASEACLPFLPAG